MTPSEARRVAIITLGGIAQTTERYRDRRGLPALDALRQDVSYAVRVLRKNPAFTATAVLTLALGIGANSAIFSVVNAVLLRPLPFRDSGQLVLVFSTAKNGNRYDVSTYPDYADWRNQNRSFSDMAAFAGRRMTIGIAEQSVMADGKRVTTNIFDVLGVPPVLGRAFRPEENQPGSASVVILNDRFWRQQLGGSPTVLGHTIRINEEPHTIVGVMPPTFQIHDEDQFYVPLRIDPSRGHGFLRVVGRLKPGVSLQQAQSDVGLIADRLARIYPKDNQGVSVNLMSLTAGLVGEVRFGFYLMLGVVAVILVIACANVAGLMLARGATRQRELAVRSALGAGRGETGSPAADRESADCRSRRAARPGDRQLDGSSARHRAVGAVSGPAGCRDEHGPLRARVYDHRCRCDWHHVRGFPRLRLGVARSERWTARRLPPGDRRSCTAGP
jgi:putative ABC transport system permease protein